MTTKRTHKRPSTPRKPTTPPLSHHVDQKAAQQLAELAVMWPRLQAALARDTAGPSAGNANAGSGTRKSAHGASAVLNIDVVDVLADISRDVQRIATEIAPLLDLDRRQRTAGEVIDNLRDWYVLLAERQQPIAKRIAAAQRHWHRRTRTVLGLQTYDHTLNRMCPDHRDNPTALVQLGDQAHLAVSILAGRRQHIDRRTGLPIEAPITWEKNVTVNCPTCNTSWAGLAQLRMLQLRIDTEEAKAMYDGHTFIERPDLMHFAYQVELTSIGEDGEWIAHGHVRPLRMIAAMRKVGRDLDIPPGAIFGDNLAVDLVDRIEHIRGLFVESEQHGWTVHYGADAQAHPSAVPVTVFSPELS